MFSKKVENAGFLNQEKFAVYGVYYAGIAISAIIGSVVFPNYEKLDSMDGSRNNSFDFDYINFIK